MNEVYLWRLGTPSSTLDAPDVRDRLFGSSPDPRCSGFYHVPRKPATPIDSPQFVALLLIKRIMPRGHFTTQVGFRPDQTPHVAMVASTGLYTVLHG